MPAIVGINLGVQCFEFPQAMFVEFELSLLFVFRQQYFDVRQPRSNDIMYVLVSGVGQCLGQLANDQVGTAHDLATVSVKLTTDEFQCCGFARTIAPNQANAFAGFNREVRVDQDGLITELKRYLIET